MLNEIQSAFLYKITIQIYREDEFVAEARKQLKQCMIKIYIQKKIKH